MGRTRTLWPSDTPFGPLCKPGIRMSLRITGRDAVSRNSGPALLPMLLIRSEAFDIDICANSLKVP